MDPLQLVHDMAALARSNPSGILAASKREEEFDTLAEALVEWFERGGFRPKYRGWLLGVNVIEYRTDRFRLVCTDICAKTWALIDRRHVKPKTWAFLP